LLANGEAHDARRPRWRIPSARLQAVGVGTGAGTGKPHEFFALVLLAFWCFDEFSR
jgi:hypothetical protein